MGRPKKKKFPLELYSAEQESTVEQFISEKFGAVEGIIEEREPEGVRLKFCIVPPDIHKPFFTLATCGAGAHTAVREFDGTEYKRRVELVICPPADWDPEGSEPEDFWYIRVIEILAKMPITDDAFFSSGNTVKFDSNFAPDVEFCGVLLTEPLDTCIPLTCDLGDGEEVMFLQVVPLYERELDYKIKRSASMLMDKLKGYLMIVDKERPCVVSEGFEELLDSIADHSCKIEDYDLDLPEINGANHIAAFLGWMIEKGMINEEFEEFFEEELAAVRAGDMDVRDFLAISLGGELNTELFTDEGRDFSLCYYDFYNEQLGVSYPGDVDNMALEYFGEERYNCDEFCDEAYLFVPYDEAYHAAIRRFIDSAYERFNNA